MIGIQLTEATAAAQTRVCRHWLIVIITTLHANQLIDWLILNHDRD